MNKILPALTTIALLAMSTQADAAKRSTFKISALDADFVESAHEIEIKYQADLGGYAYLSYQVEESADPVAEFKGQTFEVGIGIEEPWESEVFEADVYLGVGYFASSYESEDLTNGNLFEQSYNGFTAHLGAKLHPFSENLDVILEVEHNGAGENPVNDFNGIIRSKRTRGWVGVGYNFENFNFSIEKSSDDIIKASVSFRF